jgi:hypothetical protein
MKNREIRHLKETAHAGCPGFRVVVPGSWGRFSSSFFLAGGQFDFVEAKRETRCLLVQDNTEEGRVDVETLTAVFNEAEFPEFVHEKIHPRPRGPNHFREHLL